MKLLLKKPTYGNHLIILRLFALVITSPFGSITYLGLQMG